MPQSRAQLLTFLFFSHYLSGGGLAEHADSSWDNWPGRTGIDECVSAAGAPLSLLAQGQDEGLSARAKYR